MLIQRPVASTRREVLGGAVNTNCLSGGDQESDVGRRLVTRSCLWPNTGLFISPSGISELDCATTKTTRQKGAYQ